MFSLKYLFLRFKRSAPLAPSYNPMPRVNKGHLFIYLFIYFLRRFILQIEKKLIMKNDTFLWIFLLINIFMMCASLPLSYVRSGETGNLVHKLNQISTFETPFGLKLQINPKNFTVVTPCYGTKTIFGVRNDYLHAGPGEGTKLHARKNFCVFYPIELKLCTMIELFIPNNRIVFVFSF